MPIYPISLRAGMAVCMHTVFLKSSLRDLCFQSHLSHSNYVPFTGKGISMQGIESISLSMSIEKTMKDDSSVAGYASFIAQYKMAV